MKALWTLLFACVVVAASAQQASEVSYPGFPSGAVQIYPNPATDYVYIKCEPLDAHQVIVSLHNIIGNELRADTEVMGPHELRIRVKDFAAGYYLVAVRDDEARFKNTYKFVKR